jgi:transcriptional regulator NrdR family protein
MRCPRCSSNNDAVIDSRESPDLESVRRRRHCMACNARFTTYETRMRPEALKRMLRAASRVARAAELASEIPGTAASDPRPVTKQVAAAIARARRGAAA